MNKNCKKLHKINKWLLFEVTYALYNETSNMFASTYYVFELLNINYNI